MAVAQECAAVARTLIREAFGDGPAVGVKGNRNIVTETDFAVERAVHAVLGREFPEHAILSEEIPDDGSRLGQARVWMVDPIDGTRDFILGDDGFAVMIGLCVDGRPIVGAVSQPVTGKNYTGIAGVGAWLETWRGARGDHGGPALGLHSQPSVARRAVRRAAAR